MKWYEIIIITLLIPVGFYLRDAAYNSQRRPNRLLRDVAHLRERLRIWRQRKDKS